MRNTKKENFIKPVIIAAIMALIAYNTVHAVFKAAVKQDEKINKGITK